MSGRKVNTIFNQKFLQIIVFVLPLFILSCIPNLTETASDSGSASCASGQSFNSVTRSCEGASVVDGAPSPTGSGYSISEDTATSLNLTYSDIGGDLASGCEIHSSGSGLVKSLFHEGVVITSNSDIEDAHDIFVEFQDTGSLSVSTTASGGKYYITVNFDLGSTTSSSIQTALNGDGDTDCSDGDASCYVSATINDFDTVDVELAYTSVDEIECGCTAGTCSATFTPVDNFNGSSDFQYRLTDEDGTSSYKTSSLTISSVNDTPAITVTTGSLSVTEDVQSAGTLSTDAGFSIDDTNDGDSTGATLTYEVVSAPSGTLVLNSDGTYTYDTVAHSTSADSFTFRVCDPDLLCSAAETISITVTSAADAPEGTLTSITDFDEDLEANNPTNDQVTLTYDEHDGGENITACAITATSGVYVSTDCACSSNVCTVGITGKGHTNGSASFSYTLTSDTAPTTSSAQAVSFNLDGVDDNPYAFGTVSAATSYENSISSSAIDSSGNIEFNESSTHLANYVEFTVNSAYDPDGNSISAYEVVTAPSYGTVTNCMDQSGSASATDLTCTYTVSNGNTNNSATLSDSTTYKGFYTLGTEITFVSQRYGDSSNNISVELIDAEGVGGGSEEAWVDGNTVKILYEDGVSIAANIETALETNGNARVLSLIRADVLSANVLTGVEGTYTLSAGTATADSFVYRVQDSTGAYSNNRTIHFSIQPVDDNPIACEYSSYADTTVCGLSGCIGSTSPSSITPDVDGLYYYDTSSAACYVSASSAWTAVESNINDRTVNELETIIIDKIKVDEGGGDSGEDTQQLILSNVDSSNTTLIPTGNIKIVFSGTTTCDTLTDNCNGSGTPITFGDGTNSEDDYDFTLYVTPVTGQTGSSEIELTFSDGTNTTEVEFTVTVNANSATHGGWEALGATGPKVDKNGDVTESRNICPFSRDLCESGSSCYSTSASPESNDDADPDNVEAIYLYDNGTTQTCYRMQRIQVQNISYVAKTSSYVSIAYSDGGTAGSETVATTGSGSSGDPYIITVTMDDGVSTTDQIITAIEADSTADGLVKAINLKTSEDQDEQSATSIGNMSNASWESFTTTCDISHTDTESACSTYGETCVGTAAPTVTPTIIDARYYDEQNDVCYRSIGTSASTDWIPYDAAAEISLTWNEFTVSGSGSISEYQVFRRLPNESYDYSDPINIETIDGTSGDSFTFVDNGQNSFHAPLPNTVYFYEVRPVVSSTLTATGDVFNEVRMVAPPKNMAFVHRWMANKNICEKMNYATDPNNNYRCTYTGPGDMTSSSTQYYDIEKDYLVDRYEAGCPYSAAPACTGTSDGSCIGIDDPATEGASASDDAVYYARGSGKCFVRVSSAWQQITTTTQVTNYLTAVDNAALTSDPQSDETTDKFYNRAELPPLVNVTQEDAHHFCTTLTSIDNTEFYGVGADLDYLLPSRKEQIAYSQWDYANMAETSNSKDTTIANLESGSSLNSSSKCNSFNADGIESSYSDVSVPSSADFFSLPGTDTSNIRSVLTGSSETVDCVSVFGLQDVVGNVAEWTVDRIVCDDLSSCTAVKGGDTLDFDTAGTNGTVDSVFVSTDATEAAIYDDWALDGAKGPCNDDNLGDGICDANIGSWAIDTEPYEARRFFVPVGLVAHADFLDNNPTSTADMLEIGSILDSDMFHDDTVTINSMYHFAGSNHCGGLAYGGSYDGDAGGAGVWAMEFIPCDADAYGVQVIQDISYRSKSTTPALINIVYDSGTNGGDSCDVTNTYDITVYLGEIGTPNATNVAAAVNADATAFALVEAVVSGDASATQTSFSTATYLDDITEEAKNARSDVGFRCIVPIDPSTQYDE